MSDVASISHTPVQITAHPPSAFMARKAAVACGCAKPMPALCATAKKRFFAVTGPMLHRLEEQPMSFVDLAGAHDQPRIRSPFGS